MQTPREELSDYCIFILWEYKQVRKQSQREWGLKIISTNSRQGDSAFVRIPICKHNVITIHLFPSQFQISSLKQDRNISAVQRWKESTSKSLKRGLKKAWLQYQEASVYLPTTTAQQQEKKENFMIPVMHLRLCEEYLENRKLQK